eukprot:5385891-Alexandrium_andersonii.AAC.1
MRALGDASRIRISYTASVYHTPPNARPVRAVESPTYPSHSLQNRNLLFYRAVEPVYDIAEVFPAAVWSESKAARQKLARPRQNRQHLPCAVCVGDVAEAGHGVQQRRAVAARRVRGHAGRAPDVAHRPQRARVHAPVVHGDPPLPLLAMLCERLRRE